MYIPAHFAMSDRAQCLALMRAYHFATWITNNNGRPHGTPMPVLVSEQDGDIILRGHMAKSNEQWQWLCEGENLVTFMGPHSYVSPHWYVNQIHVPTWNYQAIHCYGEVTVLDNAELIEVIEELSELNESDLAEPWIPHYPASMVDAIVGFQMRVSEMQAKLKNSQNKPLEDRQALQAQFAEGNADQRELARLAQESANEAS